MFGQGGKARDLLRPASNHLHRSGQEVIELPHMLSVISRGASWTLLKLVKGHRWDEVEKMENAFDYSSIMPFFCV